MDGHVHNGLADSLQVIQRARCVYVGHGFIQDQRDGHEKTIWTQRQLIGAMSVGSELG